MASTRFLLPFVCGCLAAIFQTSALTISSDPYKLASDPEMQEHFRRWESYKTPTELPQFDCDTTPIREPNTTATSVHMLMPSDIGAVAAMGDSLTAGFGIDAKTLLGVFIEYRGQSWSIGGDGSLEEGIVTLPNILKKYNPDIKGFSVGSNFYKTPTESNSYLNVAVSGAKAPGMLSQAKTLVERIQNEGLMDVWKLVTLFIGGNDHCQWCKHPLELSAANYSHHIQDALDYLQENTKMTLVNLILPLDTTEVRHLSENLLCDVIHRVVACSCAMSPTTYPELDRHEEVVVQYRNALEDMVATGRYENRHDFTVVIQPFYTNMHVPIIEDHADFSYFAPDCFHYSNKGQGDAAQALWNNMMEPAGRKRLSWVQGADWKCPSAKNPYIYTYKNYVRP